MAALIEGRVLVAGSAEGELLRLTAPVSFWGGVDFTTGCLTNPAHPQYPTCLSGRILAVPMIVGSSSSSQVLLELIRTGIAPAGILLGEAEAIIPMAAIVAKEMHYGEVPIVVCDFSELDDGVRTRIAPDGRVSQSD